MDEAHADLSPPARLAIAYAPKRIRPAFDLLLRFDERFAGIAAKSHEPLIGQMKLAWWRDAVRAEQAARPKGEPMLSALSYLDEPIIDRAAVALADAWEILIAEQQWSAPAVQDFANQRGQAISDAYSRLCGREYLRSGFMTRWGIEDLRLRFGSTVPEFALDDVALPRARSLRPLTILAMSVRRNSGPRLIWHALTGW